MQLKAGVKVQGVVPELLIGVVIAQLVFQRAGYDFTVTSVLDGQHHRHSLHYAGSAFDVRTRNVLPEDLPKLRDAIAHALGEDFDVILEADHLHVEYQP